MKKSILVLGIILAVCIGVFAEVKMLKQAEPEFAGAYTMVSISSDEGENWSPAEGEFCSIAPTTIYVVSSNTTTALNQDTVCNNLRNGTKFEVFFIDGGEKVFFVCHIQGNFYLFQTNNHQTGEKTQVICAKQTN